MEVQDIRGIAVLGVVPPGWPTVTGRPCRGRPLGHSPAILPRIVTEVTEDRGRETCNVRPLGHRVRHDLESSRRSGVHVSCAHGPGRAGVVDRRILNGGPGLATRLPATE